MAKIGDYVRFLNSVGGGIITRIDGNIAYVDEDGFETPVMLKECVVVSSGPQNQGFYESKALKPKDTPASKQSDSSYASQSKYESPKDSQNQTTPNDTFVETKEGESLNIVLGFEPNNIKRLSDSTFDAYLVNDSNYYLYFTFLTRGNEQKGWNSRYDGMIEPGMQIFIGEISHEDLPEMDRVAVQYIPFKRGKEFELKTVACVEQRLDTTKFFKLHCFQQNPYFDNPVIALTIVRNDLPTRQMEINYKELEKSMREKEKMDRRQPKPVIKTKQRNDEPLTVDLHITELLDSTAGLSNSEMLNIQLEKFREVMDSNLRNHGKKIIFIHGKGEGVLRKAILKELEYRYKGHDFQDASFREYGFGATQVKIK